MLCVFEQKECWSAFWSFPRPIWLAETETYKTFRVENGFEEVLVEGRQTFPLYKPTLVAPQRIRADTARLVSSRAEFLVAIAIVVYAQFHSRTRATTSSACATPPPYLAGPGAISHRPDPIVIVAAPSFVVEPAYVKLPL